MGAAQSASRLLKSQRAGIGERVAAILQEREQIDAEGTKIAIERTAIDKEWVIERLRENVERAMQARPVIDRAGNPTGSYVYNGAAANRALELLGKELGMFIERRENKIVDEFDSMSTEDVEAWLDAQAERRVKVRQRTHQLHRPRTDRGRAPGEGGIGGMGVGRATIPSFVRAIRSSLVCRRGGRRGH